MTNSQFQAIGCLKAKVDFSEEPKLILIEKGQEFEYKLRYPRRFIKSWVALKTAWEANPDQTFNLIVYPRIIHFPDRDKKPLIYFELVAFNPASSDFVPGEFKLNGLWQFIAVCRTPVITIQKNFTEQRKERIRSLDEVSKKRFLKGSHLPLMWRDALVSPFRFNPKAPKPVSDTPAQKPFFVSLKANFSPSCECFFFSALLAPPLEEAPRFLKLPKQGNKPQAKSINNADKPKNSV
ncbi:hypothetical protein H6G04_33330 [Calothrix membranacea FACHB-236]|nr:hypothetical protein [Calothrix membranacea FACHB-236]